MNGVIMRDRIPILGSGWWVGVDLDGTLAHYDKYVGATTIGPPIEPMVKLVKNMLTKDYDVRIFTARVDGGQVARQMGLPAWEDFTKVEKIKLAIEQWCFTHLGKVLPVTNVKDFGMLQLYDDRAIGVVMNTGIKACVKAYDDGYADCKLDMTRIE